MTDRTPLDVERLARAMARVAEVGPPAHINPDDAEEHWPSYRMEAEEYAREYAALSAIPRTEASDERLREGKDIPALDVSPLFGNEGPEHHDDGADIYEVGSVTCWERLPDRTDPHTGKPIKQWRPVTPPGPDLQKARWRRLNDTPNPYDPETHAVQYLAWDEGYAASPGPDLREADLKLLANAILGGMSYKPYREAAERVLAALPDGD